MMKVAVRLLASVLLIALGLFAAAWLLDRDEPLRPPTLVAGEPGPDLDAWIAGRERLMPGLVPGGEKTIIWADGESKERTAFSIVYLHGFSASQQEIRPVPDMVAQALGANLHFTRLTGHALDGNALAAAQAQDWINDFAEALAVAERIGDRIIVFGTSTGATIALAALGTPEIRSRLPAADKVAGLVFVSPNLRLRSGMTGLALDLPLARHWLPLAAGVQRQGNPRNDLMARHWTTTYPTQALFPLARIMRAARAVDPGAMRIPLLLFYSRHDQVVNPDAAIALASSWGASATIVEQPLGAGIDQEGHVLAGDIVSPAATGPVARRIVEWAGDLQ